MVGTVAHICPPWIGPHPQIPSGGQMWGTRQRAKLERRMQRKLEKTTPVQEDDRDPAGFPSEEQPDNF